MNRLLEQIQASLNEALPPAPPAHIQHEPSAHARQTVAACLVAEAGGEPDSHAGMVAVMNVIQNRAKQGGWYGHDFESVALKPKQFQCFNHGRRACVSGASHHAQLPVAQRIVQLAEQGKLPDITHGATHYWASSGEQKVPTPKWAIGKPVTKIGNHSFVKLP